MHLDHIFWHQRYCIPVGIILLTCVVFGSVSLYTRYVSSSTTPGLWTPLPEGYLDVAPASTRRHVCVDQAQTTVVRAFQQRGWNITLLNKKQTKDVTSRRDANAQPPSYLTECYQTGTAAVIWTKLIPHHWNESQSWQRHNQLPFEVDLSKKAKTTELLRAYARRQGNHHHQLPFMPESYVLPDDRQLLVQRLTQGPLPRDAAGALRKGGGGNALGDNEPWVLKLSAIDVS